jgi:hypothetical protein
MTLPAQRDDVDEALGAEALVAAVVQIAVAQSPPLTAKVLVLLYDKLWKSSKARVSSLAVAGLTSGGPVTSAGQRHFWLEQSSDRGASVRTARARKARAECYRGPESRFANDRAP